MYNDLRAYLPPIARFFMSLIFIVSGFSKLFGWGGTIGYMTSKGMPMPEVLLVGAAAIEIFGGLSLLLGWRPRYGAVALLLFMIPTTLIFHNFWDFAGAERMNQMTHFMKNLTIMGGLLMIAAIPERDVKLGARDVTLDNFRRRAA